MLTDYRRTFSFDRQCVAECGGAAAFAAVDAALVDGEWVALSVDYGFATVLEPALATIDLGRSCFVGRVFGRAEHLDAAGVEAFLQEELSKIAAAERVAGVADVAFALDEGSYTARVAQIQRWIAEGDCYQINFTFPCTFRCYGHPLALYSQLRARQPVSCGGYLSVPGETLLSLSPELFFERRGRRVITRPMKGTALRGSSPEEDESLRRALLASEKERAENVMIVDLLRNDPGRLASPGAVNVEALCEVEAYPTLWQQVSTVSADLPDVSLADLFASLFPCGSITGAPKIRAMQRIAELEEAARQLYTGAFGYVAPNGDCRFNVAIRTLEIDYDRSGRLGVGSGIVIDSKPASEFAECRLKASFLTNLDPGFVLIETLRAERGTCPLFVLHLQRLERSARALGFACDLAEISMRLAAEVSASVSSVFRVRMTLAHGGQFRITRSPLEEDHRSWRIALAEERLDASDYLLGHKTSARSRYDHALSRLVDTPEVFDGVFLNQHEEVCEGARSNIFIERDGLLLTPPLRCGVLPGVMRQSLLNSGRAVEQVLHYADLVQAPAIYMANALRGLVPVKLAEAAIPER